MRGWFVRSVRYALVISLFVLLVSPVLYSNEAGSVGTQARQYLSSMVGIIVPASGGQAENPSKFSEPVTLLFLGAGFLVLERRVRRPAATERGSA